MFGIKWLAVVEMADLEKMLVVLPAVSDWMVLESVDDLLDVDFEELPFRMRMSFRKALKNGELDAFLLAHGRADLVGGLKEFHESVEDYLYGLGVLTEKVESANALVPVGQYFRQMDVLFDLYAHDNQNFTKILLYGAPGCGKTASAAHFAFKHNLRFMPKKANHFAHDGPGTDFGERAFRTIRRVKGGVMFVDEIDLVGAKRDGHHVRPSNTLLTELDGLSANPMIFVGATNQPWELDSAFLRSGRMDYCFYVPTPNLEERIKLLEMYSKGGFKADLNAIADASEYYSCADLRTICHKARLKAAMDGRDEVTEADVGQAVEENPSTAVEWLEEVGKMDFSPTYRKRFKELWEQVRNYKSHDVLTTRQVAALAVA